MEKLKQILNNIWYAVQKNFKIIIGFLLGLLAIFVFNMGKNDEKKAEYEKEHEENLEKIENINTEIKETAESIKEVNKKIEKVDEKIEDKGEEIDKKIEKTLNDDKKVDDLINDFNSSW